MSNPYVEHFLNHRTLASAAQARLCEEAWDAAIEAAAESVLNRVTLSPLTRVKIERDILKLKSTNQLLSPP